MSTQDLQWLIVRKSNSHLVKQKGLGRIFSREPGNLTALHSYKHSGIVNDKAVGIKPNTSKRGIVLTTKKSKASPRAVRGARTTATISGGPRRVAGAVSHTVTQNGYRPDLRKDAVARATAIVNAQGRRQRVPRARAPRGKAARQAAAAAPAAEEK
ncbi:hypothetical protein MSPP1_000555 [Malassezia sp. CBS 17886]|nr:hypothetical protein MSPP1_000555 [Malassezia sp. CBS 17886]